MAQVSTRQKTPRCTKKQFLKPFDQLTRSPRCCSPGPSTNTARSQSRSAQPSARPSTHECSLSYHHGMQENSFKTPIWGIFLPPSIIPECSSFLFEFREGKQLAKNHTSKMSLQPGSRVSEFSQAAAGEGSVHSSRKELGKSQLLQVRRKESQTSAPRRYSGE